eukprot:CAMPEP_0118632498 /NCGR_PEP_ID=MMETSP0785-20121206/479_1 /TAXON_ID=91992 /ORGANISM="Bolidomonas pacifica, Strain CCMP 1866" /LENGTH=178 /DNA_ID=CAMNT_0006523277 /DNA_START=13 /DNA_END=549 /DNA_ORIENTATION=+
MMTSVCFVCGNISTGNALLILKGSPHTLLLPGPHRTLASRGRLTVGLHATYTTRVIEGVLRRDFRTSPWQPSRAGSTTAMNLVEAELAFNSSSFLTCLLMTCSALPASNTHLSSIPLIALLTLASLIAGSDMSTPTTLSAAPSLEATIPMLPVPQQTSNITVFCPSFDPSFTSFTIFL